MVATAADGAAVNFGKINGVLTEVQQDIPCPWMLKKHCVAHRLEISLKDAFKNTYFTQVYYCFYTNSKGYRLRWHLLALEMTYLIQKYQEISKMKADLTAHMDAGQCLLQGLSHD